MDRELADVVERFLVEHVLVGLGNIRTRIDLIEAERIIADEPPSLDLRAIAGQIDRMESRARNVQFLLRASPTRRAAGGGPVLTAAPAVSPGPTPEQQSKPMPAPTSTAPEAAPVTAEMPAEAAVGPASVARLIALPDRTPAAAATAAAHPAPSAGTDSLDDLDALIARLDSGSPAAAPAADATPSLPAATAALPAAAEGVEAALTQGLLRAIATEFRDSATTAPAEPAAPDSGTAPRVPPPAPAQDGATPPAASADRPAPARPPLLLVDPARPQATPEPRPTAAPVFTSRRRPAPHPAHGD